MDIVYVGSVDNTLDGASDDDWSAIKAQMTRLAELNLTEPDGSVGKEVIRGPDETWILEWCIKNRQLAVVAAITSNEV